MSERGVRAVLFDLDGTLVDSLPTVAAAMSRALGDFGHDIAAEAILPLIGAPMPVLAAELTGASVEVAEQMNERYLKLYYDEFIETTRPLDGAQALLERLFDAQVPMAIVTNKNEDGGRRMVEILRWQQFFTVIVGRDTTPHPKPAPDGSTFALDELGVAAGDAAFVGDTEFDMEAATAARVNCRVGLLGARLAGPLKASGATHVADDLPAVGDILLTTSSIPAQTALE